MNTMIKKFIFFLTIKTIIFSNLTFAYSQSENFEDWLVTYKKSVLNQGISQETIDIAFRNVKQFR